MARTVIGKLSAILSLNSAKFNDGLKRAAKNSKRFRRNLSGMNAGLTRMASRLTAVGASLAAVAGVAGLGVMVSQSLASVDAMAKMSDRMEISTERLSALSLAAEITGTNMATLEKGMRFMVRTIGDVSTGISNEAAKAFEQLGLSIEQLTQMSTAEQFSALAEGISNVSALTEKAAITQKIFGRGGLELLNTLNLGAAGLARFEQEVAALGATFDRAGAAQVEKANDAMTRLQVAVKGASNILAIQLAPIITNVVTRIVDWVKATGGLERIVTVAMDNIGKAIGFAAQTLDAFRLGWNALTGTIRGAIAVAVTPITELVKLLEKLGSAIGIESNLGAALEGFRTELFEASKKDFAQVAKSYDDMLNNKMAKSLREFLKAPAGDAPPALPSTGGLAPITPLVRSTSFLQGKASRIAFGTGDQQKRVPIELGPEALSLLRGILDNTGRQVTTSNV